MLPMAQNSVVHIKCDSTQTIVSWIACVLFFTLVATPVSAATGTEDSDASNVDLCNGRANLQPEKQIEGCTAILDSADNQKILAIIYNNRGNGNVGKGQYDLHIKDYYEAIK